MKIAIYIKICMILCISVFTLHANTFTHKVTNLMWQDDESVKTTQKNWEKAIEHCENLSFAGYSDWRLPTKSELLSIFGLDRGGIDFLSYGEALIKNSSIMNLYWSSTPHELSFAAWPVNMREKLNHFRPKADKLYVRCVRDNK
jgi:hypothetical protein